MSTADLDPDVAQWVEMLRSPQLEERLVAVKTLQHLGDEDTLEPLMAALNDENPTVQEIAITTLWEFANPIAIPPLIDCLSSPHEAVRDEALSALKELVSTNDLMPLLDVLQVGNAHTQLNVLVLLRKIHDAQALPFVLPFFESESPELREAAITTLRYLNQVVRCEPALALASDPVASVRRATALTLGHLSDEGIVPLLCQLLTSDDDWQVRRNAAQSLDLLANPAAIAALVEAMADAEWQVRKFTARALQKTADVRALPVLIKALADEYSDVRRDAATALGNLAEADALPALQQTLNDPDMDVRIFSQRAIDKIQKSLPETSHA
ncbi:MAG: HEAT repeat domain-containing protein [Leptolyngbya sp. SIO1E4]|nr:HEAT repeat domain-containing protein [Leptolyngbya sp. SIO1E4]